MAVTAYTNPGTAANVDRAEPPDSVVWSNVTWAIGCDDLYAYVNLGKQDNSDWLRLTNFGFAIPAATIDGIEVKIARKADKATVIDSVITLRKTAGQVGDNKAAGGNWPLVETDITYGGPADDWNAALTPADINSADFGVDISVYNTSASDVAVGYIDCVQIRIYYTIGGGGGGIAERTVNMGGKMIGEGLI